MSDHQVIAKLKDVAASVLPRGATLSLYGSRARGTSNEGSDWDLLILLDKDKVEEKDYDEIAYPFTYAGWELNEAIIPIIYSKRDWENHYYAPFQQNVERDRIKLA